MGKQEHEPLFEQASLWGELEQGETVEYGNCTVMNEPKKTVLKNGTLTIWECTIEVHPDLFHMEQAGTYYLHAKQEKAQWRKKRDSNQETERRFQAVLYPRKR